MSGLCLAGAEVLLPEGPARADVRVANGQITEALAPGARRLDLTGLRLLPGIIDAHGDGFERHLAPRRGAATGMQTGLISVEAELLAHGITTAMLAQFWSWEGGMRSPAFATSLAEALVRHGGRVDMRLLLRVELGCWQEFDAAADLVETFGIGHVVLSDHLPHRALAAGRRVPRLEGQALKAGRAPADHQALLERMFAELPQARAALPAFATRLQGAGARLGSHDDAGPEMRARMSALGFHLAEFPLDLPTARAAQAAGDPVVMGAPNVVRGGSHQKGGTAAHDMIAAGCCDALASDYHYPSCLGAVRRLVSEGMALAEAWSLLSTGPARVLGLADRGQIAPGLRADLVIASEDLTRVHGTMVAGQLAYADHVLAARLLA